jgi:hypothetical protein
VKNERGIMAKMDRKGFRTIKSEEAETYNEKLREHRREVRRRTAIIVVVILLICFGLGLFMAYRQYTDYDSLSSTERLDTEATQFAEFQGNVLKYSNDGAFYTDAENELIWNQTYEMSNPQISICEGYLAIYDKGGMIIYILTKDGQQGSVETTMPIEQACVAAQGTVAVLMQKGSSGYLALYDKKGENLAEGEIHGENGGYPIAIALSRDALKLAVSLLDFNEGSVKSTVAFYNYGSVGQNEIDRCVGMSSFSDMVIPELTFTADDRMVALGDRSLLIFEGSQKPQLANEIPLDKEVKSVFYNESYLGIVTSNDDEEVTRHMTVYNEKGTLVLEQDFGTEYDSIEFMSNNEICILNNNICDIYTIRGVHRFHYEFDEEIYEVIPGTLGLNYTLIRNNITERVRLK